MQPRTAPFSSIALIVLVGGLVFFTNLGGVRLWDRDEPRNAGCAAEMLAASEWTVPVFNGELRSHKPILLYWLMMSAYLVGGVNEFTARFWSATLAVGTLLCTYAIGRRMFGNRVGLAAALILATSLMFTVAARAATPDSPLIFFGTLAICWYVHCAFPAAADERTRDAHEPANGPSAETHEWFPRSWRFALVLYAILGMAVLAKGPVGLVMPTAVIGLFLLLIRGPEHYPWQRRGIGRLLAPVEYFFRTCWKMRPLTALAAVLAVALPWYLSVGLRTHGAFLQEFFLTHNLSRAVASMEGHRGSGLIFYPIALLLGFLPWSVFIGPTLLEAVGRIRGGGREAWRPGCLLALGWLSVYVGMFSCAQTKLPSYITPCYPAVALLTACFIDRWAAGQSLSARFWPRIALGCLIATGLIVLIAVPIAARKVLPGAEWLGLFGLLPIGFGSAALILDLRARAHAATQLLLVGAVVAPVLLFLVGAPQINRYRRFTRIQAAIAERHGTPQFAWYGAMEPSWVYYLGKPIQCVRVREPAARPKRAGEFWVRRPHPTARAFLLRGEQQVLFTLRKHYEQIRDDLPAGVQVIAEAPYFLKPHSIVAIGWQDKGHEIERTARGPNASPESLERKRASLR